MPRPIRLHQASWLLALAFFAWAIVSNIARAENSHEAEPTSSVASVDSVDWWRLYYTGQPGAAISHWRATLPTLRSKMGTAELIYAATTIAWHCALANDDDCVIDIAVFVSELGKLDEIPENQAGISEAEREPVFLNLGLLYGLAALNSYDSDVIKNFLDKELIGGHENLFFSPVLYIKRNFIAAELLLQLERYKDANELFQKGLIALASLETARPFPLDYAQLLAHAIGLLNRFGRLTDAVGLATVSDQFIVAALPESSLEYARYLGLQSALLFEAQHVEQAQLSAERALAIFDSLDLPQRNFAGERMDLSLIRAAACAILANDRECIDDALQQARQEMVYFDLSDEGAPPTYIEGFIAVLETLVRALAGSADELTTERSRGIYRILDSPWEFAAEDTLHAGRLLGLGILRLREGEADAGLYARQALEKLISASQWNETERTGSLLNPAFSARLIASTGTAILTHQRNPDQHDASLILQAVEMYSRTGQFKDSDALAELAASASPSDRRMAHALLRIRSREADHRNRLVSGHVAELMSTGPTEPALARIDFNVHRGLVELAVQREALERRVLGTPRFTPVPIFPGAKEVQAHLSDNEVLLYIAASMGSSVISVCVTSNDISAVSIEIDKLRTNADLRLLRAALTAQHGPSVELDTQYPVNAARRIYDVFLGARSSGEHGCISPGDTVFLAPAHTFNGIPIEATLTELPARDTIGWQLDSAPWAFQRNSFVYVPSVRAFVAQGLLRKQHRGGGIETLSVGDPRLDGTTKEGVTGFAAVTRSALISGSDSTLRALAQLPNTAEESRQVFETLGGVGRLLIGEMATERELRRDLLGRYRFLHFATHGLVREELPGLREAALVFTPGSLSDPFDDGLLTASEIADLTLDADIAVLSACNTANFDSNFFLSETQGLTTAFAIAGVPATVVTLWPVETTVSERLVTAFFQHFAREQTTASKALVEARRFILNASERPFHHPRFWGAFALLGDADSASTVSRHATDKLRIFDGPGGIRSVTSHADTSDRFVLWGPYKPDGLVSSISRMDDSLNFVWQYDRLEFGRVAILERDDGPLVAFGYELREGLPVPAVIAVDHYSGDEVAFRLLEKEGQFGYVVGAAAAPKGRLLVMTGNSLDPFGNNTTDAKVSYQLDLLAPDLQSLASYSLPYNLRGGMPLNSGLVASEQHVLAFVEERNSFDPTVSRLGRFDTYEACSDGQSTHFVWLSPQGDRVNSVAIARDVSIRDVVVSTNGDFIFLGAEQAPCSLTKRLVLGRLIPGSGEWNTLYSDGGPFGSLPSRLAQDSRGNFIITSTVQRNLDANFGAPDISKIWTDPSTGASFQRARVFSEGRVTWISPDGKILYERIISGGSDVFIDGITVSGDRVLIGGEVGSSAFLLEVGEQPYH